MVIHGRQLKTLTLKDARTVNRKAGEQFQDIAGKYVLIGTLKSVMIVEEKEKTLNLKGRNKMKDNCKCPTCDKQKECNNSMDEIISIIDCMPLPDADKMSKWINKNGVLETK